MHLTINYNPCVGTEEVTGTETESGDGAKRAESTFSGYNLNFSQPHILMNTHTHGHIVQTHMQPHLHNTNPTHELAHLSSNTGC